MQTGFQIEVLPAFNLVKQGAIVSKKATSHLDCCLLNIQVNTAGFTF